MNIFNFSQYEIESILLVFVRIGGIIGTAPILGSNNIPGMMKLGFIAALTLLIFPTLDIPRVEYPGSMGGFGLAIGSELMIGVLIAYMARLVFSGIETAGTIIGFQMGFGIVNVLDPVTSAQVSITSRLYNIFAMLIFLVTNCHHYFISAITTSFQLIPPLGFQFSGAIVESASHFFGQIFVLGIKLAAPIVATLMFSNVALGLVARTVPQMNVFIVGFPLQVGLGLLMLGLTIPLFALQLKILFEQMGHNINGIISIM